MEEEKKPKGRRKTGKSTMYSLALDEKDVALLEAVAEKRVISLSEVLRQGLRMIAKIEGFERQ